MSQDAERLREQADRDLGETGRLTTLLYPVLVLATGLSSDAWGTFPRVVLTFALLTGLIGVVRHKLGRQLRNGPTENLGQVKPRYVACVLLLASCWSTYAAWLVHSYGRSWSGLLAIMVTVGIVAASTNNITSYFPLLRSFILIMVLPSAITMASHGTPSELTTAGMLLIFCLLMHRFGWRHSCRYNSLSQALFDLDRSRREQEELLLRWRSVVENAPEIIMTLSRTGQIEFINRADGAVVPEQLVGQPVERFLANRERQRVGALVERVFESNRPVAFETEAVDGNGKPVGWYSCRVGPVCLGDRVESVVLIATNITERRHMDRQLRRLTARQQAAVEDERRHIAREVHDELGQLLTALKIDLGWLANRLEDGPLQARTVAMASVVDTTMATVRRIASRLRPPLLDELGPGPALDWLVQDACSRAGLKYQIHTSLNGQVLSEEQSLAIFRICQEALTNVARHARASCVEVDLRAENGQLVLKVSDDGVGISGDQVKSSLGLLGLQERCTILGGQVTIEGGPGQGTRVEACIPLAGSHPAEPNEADA